MITIYHIYRARGSVRGEALVRITHPTVWLLCHTWPHDCLPHTRPLPCPANQHHHASALPPPPPPPPPHHCDDNTQGSGKCHDKKVSEEEFSGESSITGASSGLDRRPVLSSPELGADETDFGAHPTCYWLPVHSFSVSSRLTLCCHESLSIAYGPWVGNVPLVAIGHQEP